MIPLNWKGWTVITTIVGALAVTIGFFDNYQPRFGWMSPNNIEIRISEEISLSSEFQSEYRCDKWRAELIRLMKQRRDGDDSVETEQRIEELRARISDQNCARFD